MDGDLKKIRIVGEYMIEVWKAAGMNMDNVEFLVRAPVSHVPLAACLRHGCSMVVAWLHVSCMLTEHRNVARGVSTQHICSTRQLALSLLCLFPRAHRCHGTFMIVHTVAMAHA